MRKDLEELVCCPKANNSGSNGSKSQQACNSYNKDYRPALNFHILNGQDAVEKEFPHMAALGFYSDANDEYLFSCGGTIISELYVVTAAHCIANIQKTVLKIVRVGVVNLPASVKSPNFSTDLRVVNISVHRDFNRKKKVNDIALVKLEKALEWSDKIRPACLYPKNEDPEEPLMILGWGAKNNTAEKSEILQKAVVNPRSLDDCRNTYSAKLILTRSHFCADTESDTCEGDSGGPLQIYEIGKSLSTLVGVTSTGILCGSKYPGIYTRVSSYIDWIESIVW